MLNCGSVVSGNAGAPVAVGAVERAFASVRLVEANVCAGGSWLALSTELEVISGDTTCPL
jgi:hypothetical protein